MIQIIIYGLDQFIIERLSKDWTHAISNIYETSEDEISFIAPNCMVFHNGVEQTSWNVFIEVIAPKKVECNQKFIAEYLLISIKDVSIHASIRFNYYLEDNFVNYVNKDYPRFIKEDNLVNIDEPEYQDKHEGEGEEDIFTGDIFSSLKGK